MCERVSQAQLHRQQRRGKKKCSRRQMSTLSSSHKNSMIKKNEKVPKVSKFAFVRIHRAGKHVFIVPTVILGGLMLMMIPNSTWQRRAVIDRELEKHRPTMTFVLILSHENVVFGFSYCLIFPAENFERKKMSLVEL